MSMATPTEENMIQPQRILVVDDEKVIGLSFRRVFEPDGHEIYTFDDPGLGFGGCANQRL